MFGGMEQFKCSGGGSIKSITLIEASDIKYSADGKLKLKRKYGKFKRIVRTYDFPEKQIKEPEIIGLA